ncbi:MAG TPA: EthD domain-containing protein [Acidimicrobiales bacterium]
MIRLTAMLRRNPALSAAEFHAHWRDVHGPLVRSVPGVDRWVARYEQHPRVADRAGSWTGSEGFDGVAVQWFGGLGDVEAMIGDPEYRRIVGPDERHLVDLERSVYLLTDEPRLIIAGSGRGGSP